MNVNGKIAAITGGVGGIGGATARLFAEKGAKRLWLIDINDEAGAKIVGELKPKCDVEFRHIDVTSAEACDAFFEEVRSAGGLDIMFNCAGITSTVGLMDTDLKLWNRIIGINLTAAFLFSQGAMRLMEPKKSGSIINVSSISAQVGGIRTSPAYAASKAGILGLTRAFSKYGAPRGVRVNCIAPGIVETGMIHADGFTASSDEVPLGYIAAPEDVANTVLFLASDEGSYYSGQCFNHNGGMWFN
jgi:3-oxoacyl-[acyl-carrier protein] reductase